MRLSIILFFLSLVFYSCDNPLENQSGDVPGELVETSLSLFRGEVLEKVSAKVDDTDVWKVTIENATSAITTFYWRKSYTLLVKIEGEKGPFDYDIRPPFDVVNFSTARFLAFNQNNASDLASWQFYRNKTSLNWEYQFFVKDTEKPIIIDAGSGEVIR